MKVTKNSGEALGAKTTPKRTTSKLYAIRQYNNAVKKLLSLKMLSEGRPKQLADIGAELINGYLMNENQTELNL